METVAYEIEQAGERMMEIELRKIETQITDSEQAILHRFQMLQRSKWQHFKKWPGFSTMVIQAAVQTIGECLHNYPLLT